MVSNIRGKKEMSNKSKGSNMERELVKLLASNGWRAARVAGSGVGDEAPCDVIAGKLGRQGHVIEVKSSRKDTIYIKKAQIEDFVLFASLIGVKPALALRFLREGWLFIDLEHLKDTGKFWAVNVNTARTKGKRFSQYFENEIEKKSEVPTEEETGMLEAETVVENERY
jgi:holliday junction resolvase Hjr